MTAVRVHLIGCDDRTVMELDLDDAQLATVHMLAEASVAAAENGCQPTLRVDAGGAA